MTRAEFKARVFALMEPHGVPWIEGDYEQNTYINERLQRFAALTLCLYYDDAVLTTFANQATYSLRDETAFSKPMCMPRLLTFENGVPLKRTSIEEERSADYLSLTAAEPGKWLLLPQDVLRLIPEPDAEYSITVSGFAVPRIIDPEEAGDADDIELPDDAVGIAAVYVSACFLDPSAEADQDFAVMGRISQSVAASMRKLTTNAAKLLGRDRTKARPVSRFVSLQ